MGTAYFRVVPSRSRSSDIVIAEPSASRSLTRRRSSLSTSASRNSCALISTMLFLVAEQGEQVGDGTAAGARGRGQLGRVGRAHPARADRLGQLRLEFPFALAELGLKAAERHRARIGDDLALCLEPLDQAGRQGLVRQVGEGRRELGDAGSPNAGDEPRAAGPSARKALLLEIGGILRQHADRPPGPERKIDQGARRRQCRQSRFDLVDGQAGQRAEPALGPGR